jgi:hypothetical protein
MTLTPQGPWCLACVLTVPAAAGAPPARSSPIEPADLAQLVEEANALSRIDFDTRFEVRAPRPRSPEDPREWDRAAYALLESFRLVAVASRLRAERRDGPRRAPPPTSRSTSGRMGPGATVSPASRR